MIIIRILEKIRKIYQCAPNIIKKTMEFLWGIIPPFLKYGKDYNYYSKLLKKSQWWSKEEHEAYQLKKIKELLIYAYENIPFYREEFINAEFEPYKFTSFKDMDKIPLIDKEIIMKAGEKMVSKKISFSKMSVGTTGGTTGKQLRFYRMKNSYSARELPFINSIWGRVGYKRNISRVAQLRNQVLENKKLWKYDWKNRTLVFDTYHLNEENIEKILKKIVEWKAEYLHTYPSAALILCDYLKKNKINYSSSLKAILVTSENLYEGQKETIEKYLHAKCFTFYGHSECSALASWCECSNKYHIESEYGYIELVDEEGRIINEPDKIGEIVCTGFDNFAMPFIRYKTGDYSSYAKKQSCACGRNYILLNDIFGRWTQEMFIGKKGNKISMTAINMHSDIFKNVENYQFVQDEPGVCILRIVKNSYYSSEDGKSILAELKKKFDDSLDIQLEYVNSIEKTTRGKQRFIIQNIEMNE